MQLDTAIRFQAQDELPMPLEEAVLDYQVVAKHQDDDGERTMDVIAVAARRDMVDSLAEALRGAGLTAVGIDLSAFAMIRALSNEGETSGEPETTLYCHLGDVTNLAVARGDTCLFTRVSPFGLEAIAARLAERREIPLDEARRQLVIVGFEDPEEDEADSEPEAETELEVEPEPKAEEPESETAAVLPLDVRIAMESAEAETEAESESESESVSEDGDSNASAARAALHDGVGKLVGELRMSLDYYGAQEGVPAVDRLVLCGPGSTIPGLADQLEDALGYRVDELRPAALAGLEDHEAARLTVSYGLALEEATA